MARKKLNKKSREKRRIEHAETFNQGFLHGYELGFRVGKSQAEKRQEDEMGNQIYYKDLEAATKGQGIFEVTRNGTPIGKLWQGPDDVMVKCFFDGHDTHASTLDEGLQKIYDRLEGCTA